MSPLSTGSEPKRRPCSPEAAAASNGPQRPEASLEIAVPLGTAAVDDLVVKAETSSVTVGV
jgi:hypothetical protein